MESSSKLFCLRSLAICNFQKAKNFDFSPERFQPVAKSILLLAISAYKKNLDCLLTKSEVVQRQFAPRTLRPGIWTFLNKQICIAQIFSVHVLSEMGLFQQNSKNLLFKAQYDPESLSLSLTASPPSLTNSLACFWPASLTLFSFQNVPDIPFALGPFHQPSSSSGTLLPETKPELCHFSMKTFSALTFKMTTGDSIHLFCRKRRFSDHQ